MKLKNAILLLTSTSLLTFSKALIAQSDSISHKCYAYAHVFSKDMSTEYISTVFCWTYNPHQNSPTYPNDSLTAQAKLIFKNALPKVKLNGYDCKFKMEGTNNFYTAADAVKYSNLEINECTNQGMDIEIVTFPPCITK